MNKLSKAQRDQLLGIAMGAVLLMGLLWYFGVTAKQSELAATRKKSVDRLKTLGDAEGLMRRHTDDDAKLHSDLVSLTNCEAQLAPDQDAYAWLMNTLNNFLQSHKDVIKGVTIDSSSQADISDVGIIPKFPYRWATFHVKATGYYHDFGRFFADFEKEFPYFRIQAPTFSANAGPGMEPEKLSVIFDIVAPVANSADTK